MDFSTPSRKRVRDFFEAIRPGNGETIRRRLIRGMPIDITLSDDGFSPLHVAASRAADDVAAVLLAGGANPNRLTARGDPPLVSAAYGGSAALIRLLVDAGADVHGSGVDRCLALAIRHKHVEAACALISAGVDINASDDDRSPLEQAIKEGASADFIRTMIDAGADVNGRGFYRPLGCAISEDRLDLLDLLLSAGAAVDHPNEYGDTALMHAAGFGRCDAIARLLDRGAEIDARERRAGRTALMEAARSSYAKAVELLLARGADPHVTDTDGQNALTHAELAGDAESAQLLRERGVVSPPTFDAAIDDARREREARRAQDAANDAAFAALGVTPRPGKVTAGPFANLSGIAYVDARGKIKARITIFGRSTEVSLDLDQFTFDD